MNPIGKYFIYTVNQFKSVPPWISRERKSSLLIRLMLIQTSIMNTTLNTNNVRRIIRGLDTIIAEVEEMLCQLESATQNSEYTKKRTAIHTTPRRPFIRLPVKRLKRVCSPSRINYAVRAKTPKTAQALLYEIQENIKGIQIAKSPTEIVVYPPTRGRRDGAPTVNDTLPEESTIADGSTEYSSVPLDLTVNKTTVATSTIEEDSGCIQDERDIRQSTRIDED